LREFGRFVGEWLWSFRGWVSVERGFCEEWMKKKREKSLKIWLDIGHGHATNGTGRANSQSVL